MVFLLPASPVHAAGPTVTLSTMTSGVLTAAPSGTVGETLVIEGFGFLAATPITIITSVGTTTVPWLTIGTCTTTNSGTGTINSLVTNTTGSLCLTPTAVGNFAVEVTVPNLPGGAQTVTVSDGTNTGTATFSVTPSIAVTYASNFGFPGESVSPAITVSGFGSGESVSVATPMFTTASFSCTTGATVGTYGTCTTGGATVVAETTGGAKTITATGATSSLTATTSYTVNPWVAFHISQTGATTFSFLGAAPTSLLIEAHGLPAGTVAANSITIGGVATNHGSVVVGSNGAFGGLGTYLVVSPTANVPFGPVSVVIAGDTFNYATGNIAYGPGVWGGVLISSIAGTATSTGVVTTDASSYKPGSGFTPSTTSAGPAQNTIGFFGYGFVTGSNVPVINTPAGASFTAIIAPVAVGGSGAFFSTQTLGDTAWSSASTPSVAATYTATVTQSSGPANILSPTFGITPWIQSPSLTIVDYQSSVTVPVHGFGATDVVTVKIGGAACLTACATSGAVTNGAGTTVSGQVPDIAGGAQNVVATGSISGQVVTLTGGVTYEPMVGLTGAGGQQALSINSGGAGQTTTLRTGSNYGVHGLLANDAYQVVWNPIGGSITVGTFTSTATGGIPIPGVQFTVPSDSSGIHIVDIQNTGSYAIFGSLFGGQTIPTETPFSSAYTTGFGDLLFKNVALLQAAPSVAIVGSPESLSGGGLSAGTSYVITLSTSPSTVTPNTSPALATFTATGTGNVPSGTSVTLADTPTTLETGTLEYLDVQTAAHFGVFPYTADANAQFVLAASANLNMTSAPAGHAVVLSAHALNPGAVYGIVFNYLQSPFSSTSYTGTTVGVIAPNSVGAGSATFNVPSGATTGTFQIQLVVTSPGSGGAPAGSGILDTQPHLTVGGTSGSCTNEGTACMGITGTPTTSIQGGNTIISASFTNNSNAPQTAFIFAVVHNALGQTVEYTTATVSPAAGASQTGQLVLFGLPPGTYSVTIFAVSGSGTALSTTTSVSVTI